MDDFVHLHVHTEYSLLDGACRISDLVATAKAMGQTAVAITDHGVMYGAVDFYKAAKKAGIKPIIGCEVYVAPRTRFDKTYKVDSSPYHLVLLCKNEVGYQNLIYLVSRGYVDGFYNKPRVDLELLRAHSEGLLCLSACLAGEIPRLLEAGEWEKAKETALRYQEIFGVDNYYLEVQDHGIPEQRRILPLLARLARETGIPLVATNDTHYLKKSDSKVQNVLVCIQTNRVVGEEGNLEFPTQEFYLKSGQEMQALFGNLPGAVENTKIIADACNLDFVFGVTKLPHFIAPNGEDNAVYFDRLCQEGLHRYYGPNPQPEILARLEYERNIITTMGYVDYYLIVYDFIRYAKSRDIPVGPGRGSGAGSLAAYCIGITGIDPIRYGLLFERFLNPERISMPDFDIDFCYERRQEVIDYVVGKYGSDHVAQITTFGTMAAKAAIRDVGRALGMGYQTVDTIAKLVPTALGTTLEKALEDPKFKAAYQASPQTQELVDTARQLEGMPRHASTHAAGVVITRDPVETYVPLQKNDEAIVTQYPMGTLEELGLLKMDFLGLRNLTVLHDAGEMIRRHIPTFDLNKIPLNDQGVFDLLATGNTLGVFQFESPGMCRVLTQLRSESMEDLIAVISLYRPGPMESIPKYIQNRHNPAKVTYRHPLLRSILEVTYGCIVYQEQVMQICRELAGYSYGRADLVRRAMSKKKMDVMEQERQNFIYGAKKADGSTECVGAVANGVDPATANAIFDEMSSFASYAFNKSHAAAYALVAYQTAYFKVHFPKEYMAALLTSVLGNTDKLIQYIGECRRMGIAVLPPDIQKSGEGFLVRGEEIRYGLLAVKNIGRGFIGQLLEEREKEPFSSYVDFCERLYGKELNKRALESLIACGAMDSFGHSRRAMILGSAELLAQIDQTRRSTMAGQINLFETIQPDVPHYTLPKLEEFPLSELLRMEKEITGQYITSHPLAQQTALLQKLKAPPLAELTAAGEGHGHYRDGQDVRLAAIVTQKKLKTTKAGEVMAYVTVEDMSGSMEMLIFPKTLSTQGEKLQEGEVAVITARLSLREEEEPKLICVGVQKPEDCLGAKELAQEAKRDKTNAVSGEQGEKSGSRKGLFVRIETREDPKFQQVCNILAVFPGPSPVYITFAASGKRVLAPKELWVDMNSALRKELEKILGAEHVVYIP